MARWIRKRFRRWRRAWSVNRRPASLPATTGEIQIALCHPSGPVVCPAILTVLRNGRSYRKMADTEIRGFLDGEVKFERNVATQYHVRIGCEGSKPLHGRYEVMRVLQHWDISALPSYARVVSVRLRLVQEDCSFFPHRYPLRWPVDVYLHAVRKPWGAGRGGTSRDNLSRPEPGDAWWMDARAGESSWRIPGCSHASDTDPEADRSAESLAWARVQSSSDDLCFTGPRLARHVEDALREGCALDFLIKASATDECLPGSVKTFFAAEFGDDLNPRLRPALEIEWTAPCLAFETRPFILEPGTTLVLHPDFPRMPPGEGEAGEAGAILAASVRVDAGDGAEILMPEVQMEGCPPPSPAPANSEGPPGPGVSVSLHVPVAWQPGNRPRVRVTTAVNAVALGERIPVEILQTWTPSVARPEDLHVRFRLVAPSARSFEPQAQYRGGHRYALDFQPDELGLWKFDWKTRPDTRFLEQRGHGFFTVVAGEGPSLVKRVRPLVEDATRQARRKTGILDRHANQYRLLALQRDLRLLLVTVEAPGQEGGTPEAIELRRFLRDVAAALSSVE